MNNRWTGGLIIPVTFMAAGALILCGCRAGEREQGPSAKKAQVDVQRIALSNLTETITVMGEVVPLSTVVLTSKVPGQLEQLKITNEQGNTVLLTEGTLVQKGQQLAVIDHATYGAHARQAEAAVESAGAQFDDSAREEKRMTALFRDGAATEQSRDKSVTARMQSEAALRQAEAALELARINLDDATPESPIDGIIVAKHIDEGNIVAPGMPIITIQDISKVKIIFKVPDRYLHRIIPGKTGVILTSDAFDSAPIDTVVTRVYPAVEKATRTLPVEVLVDNPDIRLVPGMFIRVHVEIERRDNVPVVRDSALLRKGELVFVYVVQNSKANRRTIRLGISENDRYEVTEGLAEGDLVVTQGQRSLEDGEDVEIIKEEIE